MCIHSIQIWQIMAKTLQTYFLYTIKPKTGQSQLEGS